MAHRMNPFTGRDTRLSNPTSQNSHRNPREREQEEEQDIGTYQSDGGFAENSAYGAGEYSRPVPPTPGSINPLVYDTRRSGPAQRTGAEHNAEYADGYGARRPSFPASPEPLYAGPSNSRRSRFEQQDLHNSRSSHRGAALSALTGGSAEPEPEPEFKRRQPSAWRPHKRHEGDIEMQNIDLKAQTQPQPHSQRTGNIHHTNNFWHSTANTASERSCLQGFWANTRGDCIGVTVAMVVILALVAIFIAVAAFYGNPGHYPADE